MFSALCGTGNHNDRNKRKRDENTDLAYRKLPGKVGKCLCSDGKVKPCGFGKNHPRRRLRYFPEKPCTAGARTFWSLWNKIPGSASTTVMKKIMDLNQAEVAVTTQHLIDIRQERDSLLRMSDFGDMGEFLCTCSELFPEEETPEYRYTKWEEIPDPLINREWLCPNFFDIREAMEQLEEPDKDFFFDWCDRYGHDISTEDPHLLVAHYIELYGNAAYIDDEPCPDSGDDSLLYYPGISGNYFDNCFPRFEVFDDNYD